jgi:hypothetical protein
MADNAAAFNGGTPGNCDRWGRQAKSRPMPQPIIMLGAVKA